MERKLNKYKTRMQKYEKRLYRVESKVKTFKRCSGKIPQIESDFSTLFGDTYKKVVLGSTSDIQLYKKNKIVLVNVQNYSGPACAHAVWIIKDEQFKNGFSIFNANGYENTLDLVRGNQLKIKFRRDDPVVITETDLVISPEHSINTGSDAINPGYCGVFGIAFISFYYREKQSEDWLSRWQEVLDYIQDPTQEGITKDAHGREVYPRAIALGDTVLHYIFEYTSSNTQKFISNTHTYISSLIKSDSESEVSESESESESEGEVSESEGEVSESGVSESGRFSTEDMERKTGPTSLKEAQEIALNKKNV